MTGCFEYNVDLVKALDPKQNAPIDLPMDTFKHHVIRGPIGVVGMITPWYLLSYSLHTCLSLQFKFFFNYYHLQYEVVLF